MRGRRGLARLARIRIAIPIALIGALLMAFSAWAAPAPEGGGDCLLVDAASGVREVAPGGMVTHVFHLRHTLDGGDKPCSGVWEVVIPEGWQLLGPARQGFTVAPGERLEVFVTVSAPGAAAAGDYDVELRASAGEGPPKRAKAAVSVPERSELWIPPIQQRSQAFPGDVVSYTATVINRGNRPERVILHVRAPSRWVARVEPGSVHLEPGQAETVEVILRVPGDQLPGTAAVELAAGSLSSGAEDSQAIRLTVLPVVGSGDGPLHLQIPAVLRGSFSGDPRRRMGFAQGQVVGGGTFPSGLSVGGMYAVGDLKDVENSGSYGLTFGGPSWGIQLGSVGGRLTRLVTAHANGISLSWAPPNWIMQRATLMTGVAGDRAISSVGVRTGGDRWRLSTAVVMASPTEEKGEQFTGSLGLEWDYTPRVTAYTEVAASGEKAPRPGEPRADLTDPSRQALVGGLLFRGKRSTLRAEYVQAGLDYQGRFGTDVTHSGVRLGDPGTRGFALRATFNPGRLAISSSLQRFHDESLLRQGGMERTINQAALGLRLSLGRRHALSLGGGVSSTQLAPDEPLDRRLATRFSLGFDGGIGPLRYGARGSRVHTTRRDGGWDLSRAEYEFRLGLGSAAWARYAVGGEQPEALRGTGAELVPFRRIELGVRAPIRNSAVALSVGRTHRDSEGPRDQVRLSFETSWGRITTFALELSRDAPGVAHPGRPLDGWGQGLLSPEAENWIGFSVSRRVALPVPWVKVKGRIKGVVFLDEDGGGDVEEDGGGESSERASAGGDGSPGERGLPDVYVRAGVVTVRTDERGRFTIGPLDPGTYEVYVENLPSNLMVTQPLPLRVTVEAGEEKELFIPVRRATSLEGVVFIAEGGDQAYRPSSKGVPGARVLLVEDGKGTVLQEAYTRADGTFRFDDVPPGRYRVRLDPEWLPELHEPVGDIERVVDAQAVDAREEDRQPSSGPVVAFPVLKREKEIRFTYTQGG